ncbi:MAG: hypothetical protein KF911_05585 [Pseudomonadales bacterium]|nr:hypothetical protein [Pseudomonadales bacterium]
MPVDGARLGAFIARRLPQRPARGLVRVWYGQRFRFDRAVAGARQSALVGLALGEPDTIARRIAREAWTMRGLQRLVYARLAVSGPEGCGAEFDDLAAPAWAALGSECTPRIVVTLHAGNYLEGFLALLPLIPRHQPLHIIKLAAESALESAAYRSFGHLGHEVIVHRLHEHPAGRIVRELRRTCGVLIIFADVPPEFGQTRPVTLFGRPARLVAGPVLLGLLAGAILVPAFSIWSGEGRSSVRLGRPIACARLPGESGDDASVRLVRELARQIEAHVRAYPAQWALWPVLATLFEADSCG